MCVNSYDKMHKKLATQLCHLWFLHGNQGWSTSRVDELIYGVLGEDEVSRLRKEYNNARTADSGSWYYEL